MNDLNSLADEFATPHNGIFSDPSCSANEQHAASSLRSDGPATGRPEGVAVGAENASRSEPKSAFADRPRDLFNARNPQYVLAAERPEHRAICFLAAQGLSISEIAQKTGWTTVMIGYVIKQPWAQELILDEIHKAGGDAVALTLKAQALPSIQKLISLRDDPETQRETQRKSACDLLDRLYGKCVQPIVHAEAKPDELSDEELATIVANGRKN
jgi:hypothetical protein